MAKVLKCAGFGGIAVATASLLLASVGIGNAENSTDKADAYVCRDVADSLAANATAAKLIADQLSLSDLAAVRSRFLDKDRADAIRHVDDLKNAAIKAMGAYSEALEDSAYEMHKCARLAQ